MLTRVAFLPTDPQKYSVERSAIIPERFQPDLLSNAEHAFYTAPTYEYLEQLYDGQESLMCYLKFNIDKAGPAIPVAFQQMLVLLYMLKGSACCHLHGHGDFEAKQGNGYLLYLPGEARNRVDFCRGNLDVMYCCISQSYLENMVKENEDIGNLVNSFKSGSGRGMIGKPAPISLNALYQMWLVRTCTESKGFQESNLKARAHDLVMDHIKQVNKKPVRNFSDILTKSEKIFKAKTIIDENESGKLSISEIAKLVGLNEQQLKLGFKEVFRHTIGQYQMEKRFMLACKLLVETDYLLIEIAERAGYADQSSLIRVFREKLRITPHQYRLGARK